MRKWYWLGLLGLLTSCGRGIQGPAVDKSEFEVQFQAFENYSREMGRDTLGDNNIQILFGDLDSAEEGRCEWGFLVGRRILVDEQKWKVLSDDSKEALLLH